jgi:hypothetical protein
MHDAQSPSEKHASPLPKLPGVHVEPPPAPLLVLLLLVVPQVSLGTPHAAAQAWPAHAAVEAATAPRLPQVGVHASSVLPAARQATRHEQFASAPHEM